MKLADNCLQLDVGNSGVKWRLLASAQVVARGRCWLGDEASLEPLLQCVDELQQIWVSSVASADSNASLTTLLSERWGVTPWFAQTSAATDGLRNSYVDPARMGVDRWLAMLGSRPYLTGRFAVVDAGSALTVDIVDADGQHEGGYIIPGPELMERALLLDTDRVRFAEDVDYDLAPGQSTAAAVRHGIAAAQAGAVGLVLAKAGIDDAAVLFCGGGAQRLMQLSAIAGRCVPDLVFEGLELLAAGVN